MRHVVGFGADAAQPGAAQSGAAQPGADAVFEIGSITKAVVGVLLADAVARGALTLDTPVAALLPDSVDVPAGPDGAPITLAHLATHRSGLPRLPSNLMATMTSMANPYAHYDAAALYAFLDGHTLAETPGAAYAYSNLGGGLLGHALARHAGAPLDTLVRRRLARPLGMDDMRVALDAGATGRLVPGYTADGTPATRWTWQALAGAGALHATTADLLTLAEAALAPDTTTTVGRALARAATPLAGAGRPAMRVGYGWHLRTPAPGRVQVWHNGGTGGHGSFVGYDAEAGAGVVVLVGAAAGQAATRTGFHLLDALAATP